MEHGVAAIVARYRCSPFPTRCRARLEGKPSAGLCRYFQNRCSAYWVLALAVAIGTPWALPRIFGISYQESVSSALILVAASAVLSTNQLLEEGFRGLNKPIFILWSELAGLLVTVVSLTLLLTRIGIIGAAISSLLGYTTVCVALLILAKSETGHSLTGLLLPSPAEISAHWIRVSQQLGWEK